MQFFIAALGLPEETQIPTGIITAMLDPPSVEHEPAINEETISIRRPEGLLDFRGQFRRNPLVSIEDQNPLVFPRYIFQRPILFFRELAIPSELHHVRACGSRQLRCPVR